MSSSSGDKVIKIYLHYGTKEIPTTVGIYDSIKVLDPILPAPCQIIYDSVILSPAFSFSFYDIKNESHLMLIPYHPTKKKKQIVYNQKEDNKLANLIKVDREKCLKIFKKIHGTNYDEEQFEQSYKTFLDPGLSKEAAMLKDRFFTRVEGTIKAHRKLLKQFFQINLMKEKEQKYETKIVESTTSEPSTLPIEFPCFQDSK